MMMGMVTMMMMMIMVAVKDDALGVLLLCQG